MTSVDLLYSLMSNPHKFINYLKYAAILIFSMGVITGIIITIIIQIIL